MKVATAAVLVAGLVLLSPVLADGTPDFRVKPLRPPLPGGDTLTLDFTFAPNFKTDLQNVTITLRCVQADADSSAECLPESGQCGDPQRTNNPDCSRAQVLNSPMKIRSVPAGTEVASQFRIRVDQEDPTPVTMEFVLSASAPGHGAGVTSAVSRLTLGDSGVAVRSTAGAAATGAAAGAAAGTAASTPTSESKQARIDEYLTRKEERRAQKALEAETQAAAAAAEAEAMAQLEADAATAAAAAAATVAATGDAPRRRPRPRDSRNRPHRKARSNSLKSSRRCSTTSGARAWRLTRPSARISTWSTAPRPRRTSWPRSATSWPRTGCSGWPSCITTWR